MLVFTVGCTTPTQRIAIQALSRGVSQAESVKNDLSKQLRQEILNSGAAQVALAAEKQDVAAAQVVVKSVFDKMNQVLWLHEQWERSRALMRMGQQYIEEQQGILDIIKKEWDEARRRSG